jgi:transposase-like protein
VAHLSVEQKQPKGETVMEQVIDAELLAQVAAEESGQIFQRLVRGFARQAIIESMVKEVNQLCGKKHCPDKSHEFRRAGSAPGVICVEDSRVEIRRPRVRQKSVDGQESEYNLNTYEAAQNTEDLSERILAAYMAGVPTRSMNEMLPNAPKASRSEISRLWG